MLAFLASLFGSAVNHASGYRDISTSRQSYPVMAKYDKDGVLRYCDGKRAGKPVGGQSGSWKYTQKPAEEPTVGQQILVGIVLLVIVFGCLGFWITISS